MQATSAKLQRSAVSVDAAQLEIGNLKTHAREQEGVISNLQEEVLSKQRALDNICRAAGESMSLV